MPPNLLDVSHLPQRTRSDCLPVCLQMVTDYLGASLNYRQLSQLLDTQWYGTPFRHVQRLTQAGLHVVIEHLGLAEIETYLGPSLPVLACVHTADLGYWNQTVDHVVVVSGTDAEQVYVHDPALARGPHPVPRSEFELAQLEYDHLCAVLRPM